MEPTTKEHNEYNVLTPDGKLQMPDWTIHQNAAEARVAQLKSQMESAGVVNQEIVILSRKVVTTVHPEEQMLVLLVNPR